MNDKESLKREIEERKEKLRILEEKMESKYLRDEAIKPLCEFSDSEKISLFDSLYRFSESCIEHSEQNFQNEDDEHFAWEAVMELMARDKGKFWKYYSSICR